MYLDTFFNIWVGVRLVCAHDCTHVYTHVFAHAHRPGACTCLPTCPIIVMAYIVMAYISPRCTHMSTHVSNYSYGLYSDGLYIAPVHAHVYPRVRTHPDVHFCTCAAHVLNMSTHMPIVQPHSRCTALPRRYLLVLRHVARHVYRHFG